MAKMRIGKCIYCNKLVEEGVDGAVRVPMIKRGNRYAYMCAEHATTQGDEGYSDENRTIRGAANHPFTFSMELEMHYPTAQIRAELESVNFMPTQDPTTHTEFKSPIWDSMKPMPKMLNSICKLMESGHGEITEDDGTHFHVGYKGKNGINATTITYIGKYYHSLFVPLCEELKAHPYETIAVFGRFLGGWADEIDNNSYPYAHSNFINIQHDDTLEFRLCKMITADQYMKVAKMCREITGVVVTNFIEHYNDTKFDTRRYKNIHMYRKHKADVTAKKIVNLFRKYANI